MGSDGGIVEVDETVIGNDLIVKVEKSDGVVRRAECGDVLIVTSALTIAEVLWMRGAPVYMVGDKP